MEMTTRQTSTTLRDLIVSLTNNRRAHGNRYTHTTNFDPEARWQIRNNDLSVLWSSYCDIIQHEPENLLTLSEAPKEQMPLRIKFKFLYQLGDEDHLDRYTDKFLARVVRVCQDSIKGIFQVPEDERLTCVVLESNDVWYEDSSNRIIDPIDTTAATRVGVELILHFPWCRIEANKYQSHVAPIIIQRLRGENLRRLMQKDPIGDWGDIIQVNSMTEPQLIYGSTDHPFKPKHIMKVLLPYVTDEMMATDDDEEDIDIVDFGLNLEDFFDPASHGMVVNGVIDEELISSRLTTDGIMFWLPLLMSNDYYTVLTMTKDRISTPMDSSQAEEYVLGSADSGIWREETVLELAENFIRMWVPQNIIDPSKWVMMGKGLYNSSGGNEVGRTLWVKYTNQALKHLGFTEANLPDFMMPSVEEVTANEYYEYNNNPISHRALARFAQMDSPEEFETWHRNWCMVAVDRAMSGLDTDVARAVYRFYWLQFACAKVSNESWYVFNEHRWKYSEQGVHLDRTISDHFVSVLETLRAEADTRMAAAANPEERKRYETSFRSLDSLIKKLKTGRFKRSVISECKGLFYIEQFSKFLDANPDLLGIQNGVMEAIGKGVKKSLLFRAGMPEDYISKSTNVGYRPYTWDHPMVKKVVDWFRKAYAVSDELRHFMLKYFASCLKGGNSEQLFVIMTGEGANSKSMIIKLLEAIFGPSYCIKFPIDMLVAKRGNKSGPSPEVARAKGVRLGIIQEPDEDEVLRKSVVKELVGGDSFFARMLHDNGGDIEAMLKLMLVSNKVPVFLNPDAAIERRVIVAPHLSSWKPNAPDDIDEQWRQKLFKVDPFFQDGIKQLAPAAMWVLVQYYNQYYGPEGLTPPDIVKMSTATYWNDSDPYKQFISENIEEVRLPDGSPDISSVLSLSDIYKAFKKWYGDNFTGNKTPQRSDVKSGITKMFKDPGTAGWCGIRLIERTTPVNMSQVLGSVGGVKAPTNLMPILPGNKDANVSSGSGSHGKPTAHIKLPPPNVNAGGMTKQLQDPTVISV